MSTETAILMVGSAVQSPLYVMMRLLQVFCSWPIPDLDVLKAD